MAPSAPHVIPCLYNSFSFTSENIRDNVVVYDILSVKSPARAPPSVPVPVPVPVPVYTAVVETPPTSDTETDDDTATTTDTTDYETTETTTAFNPNVMSSYIISINESAKDSLLWAGYIMLYGIEKYETIENYYTEANTFKFDLVELMRKHKPVLKANKIKINALEENLVHKPFIGLETLQAIAVCNNLSVCIVNDRKYYETASGGGGGGAKEFILEKIKGKYTLYACPDRIKAGYLKYIRENYWLMENISAPIRPISAYKLQDLVDICSKLNLPVANIIPGKFGSMGTEKRKTKAELYEAICKCV
jgi:hypothetical protein